MIHARRKLKLAGTLIFVRIIFRCSLPNHQKSQLFTPYMASCACINRLLLGVSVGVPVVVSVGVSVGALVSVSAGVSVVVLVGLSAGTLVGVSVGA